jgi:Zn-dependent protease
LPAIDVAQVFIGFIVLLFSLTVHEAAHAWTADRLGDPTARLLGRVSLNPIVHADLIGTIVFPLIALVSSVPLIGWAKPVPVNVTRLRNGRRDYVLVAAAGPASNVLLSAAAYVGFLLLALFLPAILAPLVAEPLAMMFIQAIRLNALLAVFNLLPIPPLDGGNVLSGLLPLSLARSFDALRPYGFVLLYALMLSGVFSQIMQPVDRFILAALLR